MWILYFLFWTAVRANEEPLYRKIGDEAVLTPDSVETHITNIRWKHGRNIAMEWDGDKTLSYRQYKDRGSLNISTGVMMITGLTLNDSGVYTAEINCKENAKTELLVISPVSKPIIYKSCDTEMTSCVFTCSGSTTDAEPVTYWWTSNEKRWNSTKELTITKEDEQRWFICTLENPVSSIRSEKASNPFMGSDYTWMFILIPGLGLILVVCSITYFRRNCRKGDAVNGTDQKKEEIPPADLNAPNQDQTPAATQNSNGAAISTVSEIHDTSIQDTTDTVSLGTSNQTETDDQMEPCRYYNTGFCREGDMCPYLHICKYALKGNCRNGSNCRLKHPRRRFSSGESNTTLEALAYAIAQSAAQRHQQDTKQQWQFEKRSGGWWNFNKTISNKCSITNDDIEKQYQQNPHGKMFFTASGDEFELNFDAMTQTNLATGFSRKIQRVML